MTSVSHAAQINVVSSLVICSDTLPLPTHTSGSCLSCSSDTTSMEQSVPLLHGPRSQDHTSQQHLEWNRCRWFSLFHTRIRQFLWH